jgi:predicted membrane protein
MIYKEFNLGGKQNPLGSFGVVIMLIVFLVAMFFIAKGIFTVLSWVAPLLLILTAVFDYTVIIDYGKFLLKLLKENLLFGIIGIILTIIGFPIVSGFLFFKAYARKKLKDYTKQQQPKYVDYEEIKKEDEVEFLDLKKIESRRPVVEPKKKDNDYDDLFT